MTTISPVINQIKHSINLPSTISPAHNSYCSIFINMKYNARSMPTTLCPKRVVAVFKCNIGQLYITVHYKSYGV